MSEWKEYKFSDIARFVSDKIDISLISEEEYISTDNMLPNFGGVCFAEKLPQSPRCNSFLENDILFSNIRTYFKKIWLATFDGGCSADVLVIRSKNQHIVLQQYLYLLICSPDFINFTITSSNGAKMPRGDKKAILNYTFLIPPINYQKLAINHYLLFNNKIHLNTQTNQTLEAIAQAIFKHWFIDFAPVHAKAQALIEGKTAEQAELAAMASISGKTEQQVVELAQTNPQAYQQLQQTAAAFPSEFVESELGLVPKGWEVKELIGQFDFIGGSQPPKSQHIYEQKENYVRFIQNRDYSNENHKTYIPISKKNKLCTETDILMDKYGEAGKVRFGISGAYNVALAKIEPKTKIMKEYLRWYFMQKNTQNFLFSASLASTRNSLNSQTFVGLNICIPNQNILSIFTKVSENYINFSLRVKKENQVLSQTRDTLLPKLLNGEIEL